MRYFWFGRWEIVTTRWVFQQLLYCTRSRIQKASTFLLSPPLARMKSLASVDNCSASPQCWRPADTEKEGKKERKRKAVREERRYLCLVADSGLLFPFWDSSKERSCHLSLVMMDSLARENVQTLWTLVFSRCRRPVDREKRKRKVVREEKTNFYTHCQRARAVRVQAVAASEPCVRRTYLPR